MNDEINWEDVISDLDKEDEQFIVIDYDIEKSEVRFRWEYAHESLSEGDSVFKTIYPDD